MIINIGPKTFGNFGIRNGDMIAVINVIQWLRMKHNDTSIKFYMPENYIINDDYHRKFFDYLCDNWDYFSKEPNPDQSKILPYEHIMLWDFRDNIGDVVSIPNDRIMKKKLVVFPIFDAQYNTLRNWDMELLTNVLLYGSYKYENYEKIICVKEGILKESPVKDFEISTDFITNIEHIRDCEVFVGGDTGSSHFASALNRGPKELVYFYSCRSMIHTLPFHLLKGHGMLNTYSTKYNMGLF